MTNFRRLRSQIIRSVNLTLLLAAWALPGVAMAQSPATTGLSQPGLASQDLYSMVSVTDAQLSPDGLRVAYTTQLRDTPGRPSSELFILTLSTGEVVPVGEDGRGSGPLWSPDGRLLAYFGSDGTRSGIMVAGPDGSGARLVTTVTGTNHPLPGTGNRISWAPGSDRIAFVSATPGPELPEEGADGEPIVIRRYLYRNPGSDGVSYFNDNRRLHIFMVELTSGQVVQLTDGHYYEHSIDWSPLGDEILFVSNREPNPDRFFNYDIFTVNVSDRSVRRLTYTESVLYRPSWSPDGSLIAYQGTTRGLTSSETTMENTHVWVMNADGSNRREIGASVDNRQGPPAWAPDGRSVLATVQERGSVHLFRFPVNGGPAERVIDGRGRVGSFSVGPRDAVVYTYQTTQDMPQLHILAQGNARKLTGLNDEFLAGRSVTEVEAFTFVAFDGLEVEAFLTLPHGRTESSRHPMIVLIKGGPHGQQGPILDARAQAFASEGWATLMVNYRGSTGYGQAFTDAIFGDQNGREAKDVMQGTEAALRRFTWLDPDRVGVEGGSYGGQLTNWLVTQTDRYAAAIPRAGISNLISFNYLSYYHDYLAVEFGGFPHQDNLMDVLWERSPLKHVAKVRTPVMLVHGLNDHNVPRAEAEQFYIALHDVGVETVLVLYPRAGHGIAETGQIIDFTDRSIAWYKRHFDRRGSR